MRQNGCGPYIVVLLQPQCERRSLSDSHWESEGGMNRSKLSDLTSSRSISDFCIHMDVDFCLHLYLVLTSTSHSDSW